MKKFGKIQIEKCKRGDRITQQEIFKSLYNPMFRVCQRYAVQIPDAEDCMMKGFLKVFQNVTTFTYENEESFFFWVRRIMVNESLMFLRRKRNLWMAVEEPYSEVPEELSVPDNADDEEILELILNLPPGYRTVFNLYAIEGYSHAEIADMLEISESTSRTQYAKARMKLKTLIERNETRYGRQA